MKQNIGHQIDYEDMVKLLESYGEHHNKVIMSKDSNIAEYEKHLMVWELGKIKEQTYIPVEEQPCI